MNLESTKVCVPKSAQEVYEFLMKVENFEQIMPESKQKFEKLTDEKFLFQLKGMPEIVLKQKESTPNSEIILGAASDKLPFTLKANLEENGAETDVQLIFDGEFNAMMAMMIKKPIQNFINALSENLKTI